MNNEKPRLFLGSSTEASRAGLTDLFVESLSEVSDCTPWTNDPIFKERGSAHTFDALCMAANEYDYGIFICRADDKVEVRAKQMAAPRDNVVFELGLFMSAIGPTRVLAYAHENGGKLRLPSDLNGVNVPRFFFDENDLGKSRSSIYTATRGFAATIKKHRFRKIDMQLVNEWGFDSKSREFKVNLAAAKLTRARPTIGKWKIAIAARISDKYTDLYEDNSVVYSELRAVPDPVNENLHFKIAEAKLKPTITAGDKIEARILLVPPSLALNPNTTLDRAINARCREVESFSYTTS